MSIISEALRRAENEKMYEENRQVRSNKKSKHFSSRMVVSFACIFLITGCIFYTRYNLNIGRFSMDNNATNPLSGSSIAREYGEQSSQDPSHNLPSSTVGLAQLAVESKSVGTTTFPLALQNRSNPMPSGLGRTFAKDQTPKINGIVSWGDEKSVLIGDLLFRKGDYWQKMQIVEISNQGIFLQTESEEPQFIEV